MRPRTHRTFRNHLILCMGTTTAALSIVLGLAWFVPLMADLARGGAITEDLASAADQVLFLHRNFWPLAGVAVVAPALASFLLYRRMMGPFVRIRRVLRSVGEGAVPEPISLRATDYLTEEVDALNAMLENLRGLYAELRREHAELQETIADVTECDAANRGSALAQLEDRAKAIAACVGRLGAES